MVSVIQEIISLPTNKNCEETRAVNRVNRGLSKINFSKSNWRQNILTEDFNMG